MFHELIDEDTVAMPEDVKAGRMHRIVAIDTVLLLIVIENQLQLRYLDSKC
jgi:hypothetical protein